jgi:hypothetical protein
MTTSRIQVRFFPVALLVGLTSACGTSRPRTSSLSHEIPRLEAREAQLRQSVNVLDGQRLRLEQDIHFATVRASAAKCEASVAEYRAAVARREAQHLRQITDYASCAARKAKTGGEVAGIGCLLGIVITGGWGAAVCGTALVASGSAGGKCGPQPPTPTPEQIEAEALAGLGLIKAPSCGGYTSQGVR